MTTNKKVNNNAIAALVLGGIAVISCFINVLNWFFWVFAIIGVYFAVKAMNGGEKKLGLIAIGLCLLSIVIYAVIRLWPKSSGDDDDIDPKQEEQYQQIVDSVNYYDVTEDPQEVVDQAPKTEVLPEESLVEPESTENEPAAEKEEPADNSKEETDPESQPIFE
ncbi:MAG: hypothetical protein J6Y87_09160 [Muribaculaceae bacterium]|nr:hypothetical protein [Muribaculaceae bacterium]